MINSYIKDSQLPLALLAETFFRLLVFENIYMLNSYTPINDIKTNDTYLNNVKKYGQCITH